MLHVVVTSVCVISGFHIVLGVISVIVGIISSIKAEVWLAHSVSPIWSGGFFIITGILGIFCARRKTSYVIMCFTAFSVVSMVVAVVSIQLLRLGLVNHTTDGHTFQKQNKDTLIIIALALAGSEILVCLLSTLLSCRMAKVAKEELCKRREGMFHVKNDADENDNDVVFSSRPFDLIKSTDNGENELQIIDGMDNSDIECFNVCPSFDLDMDTNIGRTKTKYLEKQSTGSRNTDCDMMHIYCVQQEQGDVHGNDTSTIES